jgi:hypothetical protein
MPCRCWRRIVADDETAVVALPPSPPPGQERPLTARPLFQTRETLAVSTCYDAALARNAFS